MTWLLSLLHALLGAVAGFFGMAGIATQWVRWFRVSSAQSGAGYYVFYLAILGGALGGVVGLIASRYAVEGNDSNFVRGLGYTASAILLALIVVYAVSWPIADHAPKLDGRALTIEMEIRTPPVTPLVESAGFHPGVSLFNSRAKAHGFNTDYGSTVRADGDRRIVTTTVELGSSSETRYLYVAWSKGCQFQVIPKLPRKPTKAQFEWSEWQEETVVSPSDGWEAPGVDLKFAVRYRVQFAPERPKPLTAAERATQEATYAERRDQEQRAQLAAIPTDASINEYLPFTRYEIPDSLKAEAYKRIRESARFEEEYKAAVLQANSDTAASWMRLAPELPGNRAPVAEIIRQAGEDLGRRLESLATKNSAKTDSDDATYDVLARFGGFYFAAGELRAAKAGDFAPELRAILKTARTQQKRPGIRSDIVRVASYSLQKWAGDKPAPDDPPPN